MRTLYYQFGKNSQRLMHGDIAVLDTGDVGVERLEVDGPVTVQLVAEACGDDVVRSTPTEMRGSASSMQAFEL